MVTPTMFVIVACATGILLIVILLVTSRDKGPALGPQHALYAGSSCGAGRPISKGSSAEKIRPTVRQGLDIKAVPKVTITKVRTEVAQPANPISLAAGKASPVILQPMPESNEASAESAGSAIATGNQPTRHCKRSAQENFRSEAKPSHDSCRRK